MVAFSWLALLTTFKDKLAHNYNSFRRLLHKLVAAILDKPAARCGRRVVGLINSVYMKSSIRTFSFLAGIAWLVVPGIDAQVNVIQEHNNLSRDGVYIDAAFTPAAAAGLTRDLNFDGTISGNVYAQPLYIEGGPSGPMIIAVTESNNVYALNATTGTVIWQRNLGPAVTSGLPCGNINPLGITGTPVVDLASRSLFLDAMIDGATKKHFIYSFNVDTGATNPGWPVDVDATATYNGITFTSSGAKRARRAGSGERPRLRVILRSRRRLRQLSRLGCGR